MPNVEKMKIGEDGILTRFSKIPTLFKISIKSTIVNLFCGFGMENRGSSGILHIFKVFLNVSDVTFTVTLVTLISI